MQTQFHSPFSANKTSQCFDVNYPFKLCHPFSVTIRLVFFMRSVPHPCFDGLIPPINLSHSGTLIFHLTFKFTSNTQIKMEALLKTSNWDTACFFTTFQERNLFVCSHLFFFFFFFTTSANKSICNLEIQMTPFSVCTHIDTYTQLCCKTVSDCKTLYSISIIKARLADFCSKWLNHWRFRDVLWNYLEFHLGE